MIAGQGTIARELLEQVPDLGTVVVPVGGGGLISGLALGLAGAGVTVVGVESVASPSVSSALAAGGIVAVTVTPTLATRYRVKLFAHKTAASPLATSPVKNVYVSVGGTQTTNGPCGPPTCRVISHVILIVPSSALRVEMSKRLYTYFAVKFGPPGGPTPPLPEWLYLNAGHPSLTAAHRISADKFETTVTFSFAVGANSSESMSWLF